MIGETKPIVQLRLLPDLLQLSWFVILTWWSRVFTQDHERLPIYFSKSNIWCCYVGGFLADRINQRGILHTNLAKSNRYTKSFVSNQARWTWFPFVSFTQTNGFCFCFSLPSYQNTLKVCCISWDSVHVSFGYDRRWCTLSKISVCTNCSQLLPASNSVMCPCSMNIRLLYLNDVLGSSTPSINLEHKSLEIT